MTVMTLGMVVLAVGQLLPAEEPEVDTAEVLRLGNMVQHVDGIGDDPADLFVEAMGPPASDADKWFISVLSMRGCAACQRLKSQWTTDPWLLALADPNDPGNSWAHFNIYQREDASQAFRFERLKVTAFPTILVQPPRNGRYGQPETVVFQGVYGGDPERLARQITTAIRQYVTKYEQAPPVRDDRATAATHQAMEPEIGIDPPWQPTPRVEPVLPNVAPVFPNQRPLVPPNLEPPRVPIPGSGLGATALMVGGTSLLTLLLALGVPWLLQKYRTWRTTSGQRTLLSDEQFQTLLRALDGRRET